LVKKEKQNKKTTQLEQNQKLNDSLGGKPAT
jgi:hypothetical protein